MNKNFMILVALIVVVLAGASVTFGVFRNSEENLGNEDGGGIACTADAMMCPDGSYVGRSGPQCEFVCPTNEISGVGVLSGQVTLSPTCPVERMPPDPNCAPKAYVTDVIAIKEGTVEVVAETKTTSDGKYVLDLPSGTYIVQAESGGVFPRCEDKKVTIRDGERMTLDISCDSGIR